MLLYLLGRLVTQPGLAEFDAADYELKSSVRSEKERRRLEAEFEADREKEVELLRREAASEAQLLAAERSAWEALPYPVRLIRTRCTACHVADNYMNQRHGRIGWELVILRMQYVNAAPLAGGERSVIAGYLAEAHPAADGAALIEALQQLAVALLPIWFWFVWKIARSRFGTKD